MPWSHARLQTPWSAAGFSSRCVARDGERWLVRGVYREVVPNRRLVHTWCWEGSDAESLVTVDLAPESAGTTRLTLTHSRFAQAEARDKHAQGWTGCLAKLEAVYAG